MNLIEQLGGYEKAKDALDLPLNYDFSDDDIRKALLDYRRENNIFEVGDKVVFSNKCALNHSIWQVIKNDGNIVVAPICNHNGRVVVESNTPVQHPYSIQHATDEEINAGLRLEQEQSHD